MLAYYSILTQKYVKANKRLLEGNGVAEDVFWGKQSIFFM
jgi:hypothetical protein